MLILTLVTNQAEITEQTMEHGHGTGGHHPDCAALCHLGDAVQRGCVRHSRRSGAVRTRARGARVGERRPATYDGGSCHHGATGGGALAAAAADAADTADADTWSAGAEQVSCWLR